MDPNVYVNVDFTNVKWPKLSLPSTVSKNIRYEFLLDKDGQLFSREDLKDILKSWLHDEFNVCPLDFDFMIVP